MSHAATPLRFIRQPLALAIAISTSCVVSQFVDAQTAPILEEVLITAQKRVETLQEVPISVSAVSGEKLDKAGVENLEDLTAHLPNIHFTETGISTQVRVRGIGSDNSQGFEQSVGTYIDGIYYGRAQLFRAPMMDLERAELLRGPQSTLFGKNSIAGALNLTTARPTDELTGRLAVSVGDEFGEEEINGMISGPVGDKFRARLAIREYEDEGYFYNHYTREDSAMSDESTVRLSVELDATDKLSFFLKGERSTFDTVGRAIEITRDVPLVAGELNYNEYLTLFSQPGFDAEQDYVRDIDVLEFSNNEINNFTLEANYDFEEMILTLVSGQLGYKYDEKCDCDFVAANVLDIDLVEDYDQFSQEIRLSSNTDGDIEWIGGLYYQTYDQEFTDHTHISADSLVPQLSAQTAVMADSGVFREFEQSSDSWAIFGQATWSINPQWHLTFGARYTEETKDAHKVINITETATSTEPVSDPMRAEALGTTYLRVFLLESEQSPGGGYDVTGSRDESAFTPMLNLQYDITDEMMLYASYTNGFKAGGFDPRSNRVGTFGPVPLGDVDPLLHFEFEEERANAFELGMKTSLADGRGELNVALYRTDYEDLQISQFDGGVGFNVGNAKDTLVQGIEVDGRWALAEGFTLSYGAAWLDFEYKDFKNGNCYEGQPRDGVDLDNDDVLDTCDYTGMRGVYTPELTLNLSLDYVYPLTGALDLVGFVDMQYIDEQQVHVNLDPNGMIDAYTMLGARFGVDADNWSLAVVGKNLTDEAVVSYSANAPLSGTTFGTNTFYSFVRKPQTVALEGVLKF